MSVKYDGKSPGKLWYFWQNTKAMMQTPFQYGTEKDAKKAGKDVGIFVGTAAVTSFVLKVPIIAALPLAPTLISLVGFSVAINFGYQGFRKLQALKSSSFVYSYVREQENKWLENKAKGNVFSRGLKAVKDKVNGVTSKIAGAFKNIPLPLVKAGKWLGIAAAAVGGVAGIAAGLSYAGLPAFSTGAAATSVLGGIATAGAAVGLTAAAAVATVTGLAVLAVPLGLAAAAVCRKAAYTRDPDRPVFKKPAPNNAQPIDRGEVFTPKMKAASFEFNDNSNDATPVDDSLTAERKKAAEQRAANRGRRGGGNRFN